MSLQIVNFTSSLFFLPLCDCCSKYFQNHLNRTGKSENPHLAPEFTGKAFSFLLLSMTLAVAFIMLKYVPSIPTLMQVFFKVINGCWILSNGFSASIERGSCGFLPFLLLMVHQTYDLQILNYPCISGVKPPRSWHMILFCTLVN